jgi:hypothetical protein
MVHPLRLFALLVACAATLAPALATAAESVITVYKSPSCGCCEAWIEHLREAGFSVEARDELNLDALRTRLGVPRRLAGCHTATVDGYVVAGHVPAEQVKRLLREKPALGGIAVPGMPVGSPGMEGPGGRPYRVMSWTRDGKVEVISIEPPRER